MYMDYIKLFAKNEKELKTLIQTIIYREDIGIEFDRKMCFADNKKLKRETTEAIELSNQERIRMLGEKENNKYWGILEADTI